MRIRYLIIGVVAAIPLCVAWAERGDSPEASAVIAGMIREQALRFDRIESYTRMQRYSVIAERFGLKAEMVAKVHRDRIKGKTFEVLSRSGSAVMQNHVFDPLIEAEITTSHEGGELLTTENYSFRLEGREEFAGRQCYVVETTPRHKDKRLLKGKIWVDPEDFGIVHVEGRPSESLSFWVGKPMIVQDFTRISGFWWARERQSHIDSFFAGTAELTIDYSDYQFEIRETSPEASVSRDHGLGRGPTKGAQ
jgi:hypothetical protein